MAERPNSQTMRIPALVGPESAGLRLGGGKQEGFALVAVIWTLGLITLLGAAVIIGARYRTKTSSSYAAVAAAEVAAESAINLAIVATLAAPSNQSVKFPLRCRLPGGERAIITVEEETGKFDLNTATPAALTRLFVALTGDQSTGARIALNVVAFRSPRTQIPGASGSKPEEPRFTTIMQLDQIDGVSPKLFRVALRHTTVRSGRPEPELEAASPALLALLRVEPKKDSDKRGFPASGNVTFRADIVAADETRFIREALVSLGSGTGHPFAIREWRRGDIDRTLRRDTIRGANRTCLRLNPAPTI